MFLFLYTKRPPTPLTEIETGLGRLQLVVRQRPRMEKKIEIKKKNQLSAAKVAHTTRIKTELVDCAWRNGRTFDYQESFTLAKKKDGGHQGFLRPGSTKAGRHLSTGAASISRKFKTSCVNRFPISTLSSHCLYSTHSRCRPHGKRNLLLYELLSLLCKTLFVTFLTSYTSIWACFRKNLPYIPCPLRTSRMTFPLQKTF